MTPVLCGKYVMAFENCHKGQKWSLLDLLSEQHRVYDSKVNIYHKITEHIAQLIYFKCRL